MKYNIATGVKRSKHNLRKIIIGATASLVMAGVAVLPTMAAGHSQNGPTVGDCISDGFYGNEPNMASGAPGGPSEQAPGSQAGNVVPSQSPGPKKTLPDGTVVPGNSVGDYQQMGISIPQICRTITQ
jgi:hypothetical protein